MNYLAFILISILITSADSKEQILSCQESINSNFAAFGTEFTKIIDFKNRTLSNTTGSYNIFDKVVLFGRNEIILQNILEFQLEKNIHAMKCHQNDGNCLAANFNSDYVFLLNVIKNIKICIDCY